MVQKPVIYHQKNSVPKGAKIIEAFDGALKELFFIRNPKYKRLTPEGQRLPAAKSVWVYYQWLNKAVRCPEENIFFEIKTARNKNLINKEEQENYRNLKVGIMGMSIGSNIIWPLVASGGPKFLRIADADTIEISNLNRMLAPLTAIGENKAEFMARKIYEMDPFMELDCWPENVTEKNIEKFISGIDLLFDEIDNLYLKFLSREMAKKLKIPVVMITNVGHNVILDAERFDLEPDLPILRGLFGGIKKEDLKNPSYPQWVKMANKIVSAENFSKRMKETIREIGKTVASVPQLGSTGLISGSIASMAVMKIANRQKLKSGRYFLGIDDYLM